MCFFLAQTDGPWTTEKRECLFRVIEGECGWYSNTAWIAVEEGKSDSTARKCNFMCRRREGGRAKLSTSSTACTSVRTCTDFVSEPRYVKCMYPPRWRFFHRTECSLYIHTVPRICAGVSVKFLHPQVFSSGVLWRFASSVTSLQTSFFLRTLQSPSLASAHVHFLLALCL